MDRPLDRMEHLDRLIAATRADRAELKARAEACAGDFDRKGFGIEAAACAIREMALLEARRAIVGRVEPGYELRIRA